MHMWHHVTNHLIISYDKDSNSEMNEKLCVCDNALMWPVSIISTLIVMTEQQVI
jgi:hypothetical protein